MLTKKQLFVKRFFDIVISCYSIILLTLPILILTVFAFLSTKKSGIFKQERIGQYGNIFIIYKLRTMLVHNSENYITIKGNHKITKFGQFLRKYNLDELPQIYNVFCGTMSFVGPRPDVIGYADELRNEDKIILSVKPGITGPATLKFKNEEELLSKQENPKKYNDEILWKQKIEINKNYIKDWSLIKDMKYIIKTIF